MAKGANFPVISIDEGGVGNPGKGKVQVLQRIHCLHLQKVQQTTLSCGMWHVTKAELGHHERVAEIKEHNSEIGLPVSQVEI